MSTAYKTTWPKRPVIIVIDSAMYLLTISLPDIDKVALSLYDISDHLIKDNRANQIKPTVRT